MIIAAVLTISGSVFAQTCEVEMVESRSNRLIRTYRAYDCYEAKKQCSKEIRTMGYYGRAECIQRDVTVYVPTPIPNTRPDYDYRPNPNDYQTYPDYNQGQRFDAIREVVADETVIYNNKYVTVVGKSFGGSYTVRTTDSWPTLINNLTRSSLSVTRGCNLGLCVKDLVININTSRYVKIAALSYDGRFIVQSDDSWPTLYSGIDRQSIAELKGCINLRYGQICVGNTVINPQNRYYTVVGIQSNGRVVLATQDSWKTLSTNVDPMNLTVTR